MKTKKTMDDYHQLTVYVLGQPDSLVLRLGNQTHWCSGWATRLTVCFQEHCPWPLHTQPGLGTPSVRSHYHQNGPYHVGYNNSRQMYCLISNKLDLFLSILFHGISSKELQRSVLARDVNMLYSEPLERKRHLSP